MLFWIMSSDSVDVHQLIAPWEMCLLTHWGQVTHICFANLTFIGSDNGLLPCQRKAIIWANDAILLTFGTLETYFNEILIKIF